MRIVFMVTASSGSKLTVEGCFYILTNMKILMNLLNTISLSPSHLIDIHTNTHSLSLSLSLSLSFLSRFLLWVKLRCFTACKFLSLKSRALITTVIHQTWSIMCPWRCGLVVVTSGFELDGRVFESCFVGLDYGCLLLWQMALKNK